jgi:hypothetical protein
MIQGLKFLKNKIQLIFNLSDSHNFFEPTILKDGSHNPDIKK